MKLRRLFLPLLLLLFISCEKGEALFLTYEVPKGFPEIYVPEDNIPTVERIALGKLLFFDPILSRDSTVSCGSCHLIPLAFTDGLPKSKGIDHRFALRNSPSLANVAYQPYLFMDGGVPNIEQQVLAPIGDPNEMGFSLPELVERLSQHKEYTSMALDAYGRTVDVFVITRAIACYERSLLSGNSPYDEFENGNDYALSEAEQRGKVLFESTRTNCSKCHVPPLFTDFSFRNNGMFEMYADTGRMRVTLAEADRAKFKVPSLRNVGLTAPYMHDGSITSLESVLEQYNKGGSGYLTQDSLIKPLGLSANEKADLIAFLRSLTDMNFINGHL